MRPILREQVALMTIFYGNVQASSTDLGAGVAFLFLYQSVGSRTDEVVNKMLHQVLASMQQYKQVKRDVPKRDTQAHDGLGLKAV